MQQESLVRPTLSKPITNLTAGVAIRKCPKVLPHLVGLGKRMP